MGRSVRFRVFKDIWQHKTRSIWLVFLLFSNFFLWMNWDRKRRTAHAEELAPPSSELLFQERLTTLHQISIELTKATTFDDLCYRAVEAGRNRLGFDRLGLWLWTQGYDHTVGSYGTDEHGNLRDERNERGLIEKDDLVLRAIREKLAVVFEQNAPLYNHKSEIIGRGWNAMAALWDGDNIIGWFSADNLLHQQPLTSVDLDILKLYGATVGHLCTRKLAEEALLQERNLLRTIIDTTLDHIYIKDTQSRFLVSNRTSWANKPQASSESDVVGQTDFTHLPKELAALYTRGDQEVFTTGQPVLNREEPGISRDGQPIILLTSKIPIRDAQGNITGLVGVSRDITDRKRIEQQQLELALQKEKVQLLNEFISTVSHDLKTPLATIKNSLYLIERADDPLRAKDKLRVIDEQTHILERYIQDILAMSRLDHSLELVYESLKLNDVVLEVESKLQAIAEKNNQTIRLTFDDALPLINGNRAEMYRATINLMENALYYTPENGTVSVTTRAENNWVIMEFSDTGIGIQEADLPHIFERFYRADKARSMVSDGTGLGLAIVKKIVELHNGRIAIESTVGTGSRFIISLPAKVTS